MKAEERARAIAEDIIDELTNRRGFRHVWDSCDEAIQWRNARL